MMQGLRRFVGVRRVSYQMSRVRGTTAYRLQVTRATTVATICAWIGVDRDALLHVNPDLQTEELYEGQELVIPAVWVQQEEWGSAEDLEDDPDAAVRVAEEDVGAGEQEPTALGRPADADIPAAAEPDDQDAASDIQSHDVATTSGVTGEETAGDTEGAAVEEGPLAPSASPMEAPDETVRDTERYTVPAEQAQPVKWRPFPKPIL